jgi:protein TonB
MRSLIAALFIHILNSVCLVDDCPKRYNRVLKKEVYTFAEVLPEFPGGTSAYNNFIIKNYNVPQLKTESTQGSFKFEIIIDVDGQVRVPRIINKEMKNLTLAEKELLRVLKNSPKWKPGLCHSKKVPVALKMQLFVCLTDE